MFKIIILSQIGADRYQKHIFEILLLSPPWSVVCSGANMLPLQMREIKKPNIFKTMSKDWIGNGNKHPFILINFFIAVL